MGYRDTKHLNAMCINKSLPSLISSPSSSLIRSSFKPLKSSSFSLEPFPRGRTIQRERKRQRERERERERERACERERERRIEKKRDCTRDGVSERERKGRGGGEREGYSFICPLLEFSFKFYEGKV